MPALNDARCPKCRARIGWGGELKDCPPCPKCGYQIPQEEWDADEKMMREFEETLRERKHGKRGPSGSEDTPDGH